MADREYVNKSDLYCPICGNRGGLYVEAGDEDDIGDDVHICVYCFAYVRIVQCTPYGYNAEADMIRLSVEHFRTKYNHMDSGGSIKVKIDRRYS